VLPSASCPTTSPSPPSVPSPAPASSTSPPKHKLGYRSADPSWCNLGQGQPETGPLPGAPPRTQAVTVRVDDQEYAPVPGLWELREAVASLYNRIFRKGLPSQYSAENVSISGGGRAALTRAAASLGHVNLGHFLPDYTAYEELSTSSRPSPPSPSSSKAIAATPSPPTISARRSRAAASPHS